MNGMTVLGNGVRFHPIFQDIPATRPWRDPSIHTQRENRDSWMQAQSSPTPSRRTIYTEGDDSGQCTTRGCKLKARPPRRASGQSQCATRGCKPEARPPRRVRHTAKDSHQPSASLQGSTPPASSSNPSPASSPQAARGRSSCTPGQWSTCTGPTTRGLHQRPPRPPGP